MSSAVSHSLDWIEERLQSIQPILKVGKVTQVAGLVIESDGPEVSLGDIVSVFSRRNIGFSAEVVGFRDSKVLLMPLEEMQDIHPGCRVISSKQGGEHPVGDGLVGRVINGLGKPIDDLGPLRTDSVKDLASNPANPMHRSRITEQFHTGVKAIDCFTPLGTGQRLGIFAGSGVGKSSLLGMMARSSDADVNVIALIGERGRELNEFIESELGTEGLKKSVIVISTSDQPAPLRLRAALLASRIAEDFRDQGKNVLFLMDSVTRFAMAQREIGLAVGEPPTSRGYTPSVFSKLPRLIERSGKLDQGAITAIYTVLVEGDDMNEPIADATRGLLDGHIVLSRALATANHHPAIDVLESISRLERQISSKEQLNLTSQARDLLSIYRNNEDLINVGAYTKGSSPKIDKAIQVHSDLMNFLKQPIEQAASHKDAIETLASILQ